MTTKEMLALCEREEEAPTSAADVIDRYHNVAWRLNAMRTVRTELAAAVRQLVKERDEARQATRDAWSAQHHALDLASDRAVKIENAINERDEARRLGLEATQYALDLDGRDDVVERLHEIRTALEGK